MEEWTRWQPSKNLPGKYYLTSWSWPQEGLLIELSSEKRGQKIQLLFDGTIGSFRYTNESFCFNVFGKLSKKYGGDFYQDWSFFKINNSEYLKWMVENSDEWADKFDFVHFCIIGGDEMIDIIANDEPKVKIIK